MRNRLVLSCWVLLSLACGLAPAARAADVPGLVAYQGRIATTAGAFTGTGSFKFAFVDQTGTTSWWSNDGSSVAGSEPTRPVPVAVQGGLFAVMLGDPAFSGMTVPVDPAVFSNSQVHLRIWFSASGNPGTFELLAPDRRMATAGYAFLAHSVADGAIGDAQVNAVAWNKLTGVPALVANGGATPAMVAGAADPVAAPAAGVGTIYVATGSANIFRWDGSSWQLLASGASSLAGDVAGPAGATTVAQVGGLTAGAVASGAALANAATAAATGNALVRRNAAGDFSAGTITAAGFTGPLTGSKVVISSQLDLPRDADPVGKQNGSLRFNTTTRVVEYWDATSTAWIPVNTYAP